MMAPPPGNIPSAEPITVPRPIAFAEAFRSGSVGIKPVILPCTISRVPFISRLRRISPKPNTPMPTTTKPMPSDSSGMPHVMRSAPVSRSEPIIDRASPIRIIASAFSTEPFASTTAKIRPSTISEKYSAGPNISAMAVSGAPSAATSTVATHPAKNDPIAAIASAGPARPCFAIWWPSSVVTTDDDSPGMLTRIDVVEPPYCAP